MALFIVLIRRVVWLYSSLYSPQQSHTVHLFAFSSLLATAVYLEGSFSGLRH